MSTAIRPTWKPRSSENLPNYRRGLVVTDGVFSMDGDVAPLDKIYEVAERHGVMTMVDDAHGEGVLGRGKGIVSHFRPGRDSLTSRSAPCPRPLA